MRKKIRKILMNYLQIKNLSPPNEELLDLKLTVDLAIKKLNEMGDLTLLETKFIDLLEQGFHLKGIQDIMNISQTRTSLIFKAIVEKIYRITGDF